MKPRRPRCVVCAQPIDQRGEYAGQPFHSQACARVLLQRILIAIPGVVDLLPEEWRADKHDPKAVRLARKLEALGEWKPKPHRMAERARRSA